jgi:hypothetical protein
VPGNIVYAKGKGLIRYEAKTEPPLRTVPLPRFEAQVLAA